MWKLLRNLVLAGALLAGALKLLAWYAAQQDVERLRAALAPVAELKYDGLAAGFDGGIRLSGVSLAHLAGHRIYRADRLTLETPGLFWLLKHALLRDTAWPTQFALEAEGLKLPPLPWLDPRWFDSAIFVPFGGVGCGTIGTFGTTDLRKMGAPDAASRVRLEYRLAADAQTLSLGLGLSAPGIADWTLKADLRPFDAAAALRPAAWEKLHVERVTAEYADQGFLRLRNQFCAQRIKDTPRQFVESHLEAVKNLLAGHRIEASGELLQLYRELLEQGGTVSVLSLPNPGFTLADVRRTSPAELLRQLNVTARYRARPPIMFRLAFLAPPETEPAAATEPVAATPAPAEPTPPPAATAPAQPPPAGAVANVPVAPPPAAAAVVPTPAAAKPAVAPPAPSPPVQAPVAAVSKPAPPAAEPAPAAKPSGDSLGLRELDRAMARFAPPPAATPPPRKENASAPELASSPPPPPDSTLALVWKPTIERLPPAAPEQRDYDPIEFAGLKNLPGRRVRLVTDGGKRIEGYVIAADDNSVRLRIRHPDGDFTFEVPKARVQEVQLLRGWPPG